MLDTENYFNNPNIVLVTSLKNGGGLDLRRAVAGGLSMPLLHDALDTLNNLYPSNHTEQHYIDANNALIVGRGEADRCMPTMRKKYPDRKVLFKKTPLNGQNSP